MTEILLELQQLQHREERCHKLFEGQIALMNKTADLFDKLDPNWKDNKNDTAQLSQTMISYFQDYTRRIEEIDRAKQNIIASDSQ
jgi:hypothetical protein